MNKQCRILMRMNYRSPKLKPSRPVSWFSALGFSRNKQRFVLRCAVTAFCALAFSFAVSPLVLSQDKKQKPKPKPPETTQKKETKQKSTPETKQKKKPKTTPVEQLITKNALGKIWKAFTPANGDAGKNTWQLVPQNGNGALMLKCVGTPHGYLRTEKEYENYVLELEFRYPGTKECNSGILLHCNKPDKNWPGSIQIQLHYPKLGNIFEMAPAKTDNRVVKSFPPPVLKEWIKLKIESKDGTITLHIDGKKHGTINGCNPQRGYIALQSEGYEIHFRNIIVKELPAPKPVAKKKKQ